ncbi:MAG: hypothetical protein NTY70_02980 [Burkholderiales bacterium]|nr:hypothetical protein [Burkholderiales bacterium]
MPAEPNNHTLAGGGLGLRYTANKFNLDMALAWRSKGGKPVSDTKDDKPRLWLTGRYVF